MPSRSSSQVTGSVAELQVALFFNEIGWVAHTLGDDFGEDFLVQVFEKSRADTYEATPYVFYVQVKGKAASSQDVTFDPGPKSIKVRAPKSLVRHWVTCKVPVALIHATVSKPPTLRWTVIQDKLTLEDLRNTTADTIAMELTDQLTKAAAKGFAKDLARVAFRETALESALEDAVKILNEHGVPTELIYDPPAIAIRHDNGVSVHLALDTSAVSRIRPKMPKLRAAASAKKKGT